jgi:hypothetical protein
MHDHRIGVQVGFMLFSCVFVCLCVCVCVCERERERERLQGDVGAQLFAMTTIVGIKVMSSSHIFIQLLYTVFCILVDANLKVSNSSLY